MRLVGMQQVELARQAHLTGAAVPEGLHAAVVIPRAYSACRWRANAVSRSTTSARCRPAVSR